MNIQDRMGFPFCAYEQEFPDGRPETAQEAALAMERITCTIRDYVEALGLSDPRDEQTVLSLCVRALGHIDAGALSDTARDLGEIHSLIYYDGSMEPDVKENILRAIELHSRGTY